MDKDFLDQLRKTDPRTLMFGIIAFLSLIAPVALEIFIVDSDVYEKLSVSKIILLALGATLPLGVVTQYLVLKQQNAK